MKIITKLLLVTLLVSGLQFALTGCLVGVDGGGRGWYHDGPWVDGGRWGGRMDIHPPGRR